MSSGYSISGNAVRKQKTSIFRGLFGVPSVKNLLFQISYIILGFLSAKGSIFGGYIPFSAALAACVPIKNLLACSLGIIVGCFVPAPVNESFRYVATILAIMAIRWILNDLKILKGKTAFTVAVSILPLMSTGIAMSFYGTRLDTTLLVMYLTETVICAASAYFFSKTIDVLYSQVGIHSLSQQELACIILSFYIAILSFTNITIGYVSVGRVIAVTAVLYCAYFGSVAGGAVSGVVSGVIFGLETASVSHVSGAYALGGLIAGIFAPMGKLAVAVSFILSNGVLSFHETQQSDIISTAYEILAATIIFMLIPQKYVSKLKVLFDNGISQESFDCIKRNLIMRLDFSSKAISSVSDSIESVAQKMNDITVVKPDEIYQNIADNVCNRCGIKQMCWNKEYDSTINMFKGMSEILMKEEKVSAENFPESFTDRCSRLDRITKMINDGYESYTSTVQANRRVDKIREVTNNQFCTMGEMLEDISAEVDNFGKFFPRYSSAIKQLLKEHSISVMDVVCRTDISEHMFIEIETCGDTLGFAINKMVFREMEKICGCELSRPLITTSDGFSRVQISQLPNYRVHYALRQHVCDNKGLCGDSFKSFNDGAGHMVFILSDGMGSGGRAAVDGAMATGIMARLVKAGLSYDSAMKMVNSSILVKSGEESFATLDVVVIDMFTGRTDFMKAGAATSFVRRNKKIIKVETPGLPLGILNEVSFSRTELFLKEDDCIIMVSDGVIALGDDWVEAKLLSWKDEDEQKLSSDIVKEAKIRRSSIRDDDMTAAAIRISLYQEEE